MTRRWVLLLLLAIGLPVSADETVSAQDIETLLSGNTIKGTWSGSAYVQYFDPSGMTVYIAEGRPAEFGRWRVNFATDSYESWWQQTDWVAYTILKTAEGYAWKRSVENEPFEVLEGKQISW